MNSARANELAKNPGIADPSIEIAETLMAALSKKYSLARVEGVATRAPVTVEELSKPDYPQADLILAVGTLGWGFGPIGRGQSHVSYSGTLHLIDMRTQSRRRAGHAVRTTRSPTTTTRNSTMSSQTISRCSKAGFTRQRRPAADDYRFRILGIFGEAAHQ